MRAFGWPAARYRAGRGPHQASLSPGDIERLESSVPYRTGWVLHLAAGKVLFRDRGASSAPYRGARDLPTRQQTLRNTIEWSFDLLMMERRAIQRLAVFVDGSTLGAIESVCNHDGTLQIDVPMCGCWWTRSCSDSRRARGVNRGFVMLGQYTIVQGKATGKHDARP